MANLPTTLHIPASSFPNDPLTYRFIEISGYCYKRVEEDITLPPGVNPTDPIYITGFTGCADCLEPSCPADISFTFLGAYNPYDISKSPYITGHTFDFKVAGTGWVDVMVPSGYLNQGTDLKPSGYGNFSCTDIRCTYRRLDFESGIEVEFDDPAAQISHFQYEKSSDLYSRTNLRGNVISGYLEGSSGHYGSGSPQYKYINIFDSGNRNTSIVKRIKFFHDSPLECNYEDIWFRLRGDVTEDGFLKYGNNTSWRNKSWVYLQCKDVPYTPGAVIDCIPHNTGLLSGKGLSFNNYFESGDFKIGSFPTIKFAPKSLDVVNMPMLTGTAGSDSAKRYSTTGGYHFGYFPSDEGSWSTTAGYVYSTVMKGGYNGTTDYDFYDISATDGFGYSLPLTGSLRYLSGVGRFNYKYHFPANETGFASSRKYITQGLNPPSPESIDYFQYLFGQRFGSMALTPSEFGDGLMKNGTYRPMMFTGEITGRLAHWNSFFGNRFESEKRESWRTGVYVFQYYESGDAHRPNQIKGWFGLLSTGSGYIDHYRHTVENHSPVNMGNKLSIYNYTSGNFPLYTSQRQNCSVVLNMGNPKLGNVASDQGYQLPIEWQDQNGFTFDYDKREYINPDGTDDPFDDYEVGYNHGGIIVSGNYPYYTTKTLVPYSTGNSLKVMPLLVDSGRAAHSPEFTDPSNTYSTDFVRVDGVKFVLSFNNGYGK